VSFRFTTVCGTLKFVYIIMCVYPLRKGTTFRAASQRIQQMLLVKQLSAALKSALCFIDLYHVLVTNCLLMSLLLKLSNVPRRGASGFAIKK
jgi:hypothetical protein